MLTPIRPSVTPFGSARRIKRALFRNVTRVKTGDVVNIYALDVTDPRKYSTSKGGAFETDENKLFPYEKFILNNEAGSPKIVWYGATFGSEKSSNPSMDLDLNGYNLVTISETATFTHNITEPISGAGDGLLSVTVAGTNSDSPRIQMPWTVTSGKYYQVEFDANVISGNVILDKVGVGGIDVGINKTLTGNEHYKFVRIGGATPAFSYLRFDGRNIFEIQIDNISVKEVLTWGQPERQF